MKNRRQFIRLTALALGGIAIGCGEEGSSGMGRLPEATVMDTGTGPIDRGIFPDVHDAEPFEPAEITDILEGLPDMATALDEILLEFFGEDLASVYIIGQTYLVDLGERSAQDVADILSESLNDITEIDDAVAAADALNTQVNRNFTDVDLENVRGWWLAKTEVHLCTLAYLVSDSDAPSAADLNVDL